MPSTTAKQEFIALRHEGIPATAAVVRMAQDREIAPWRMAQQLTGVIADTFILLYFPIPRDRPAIEVEVRTGLPSVTVVGAPDAYTARVRAILSKRDKHFLSRVTVNIDGPLPPHAAVADAIEAVSAPDDRIAANDGDGRR
jgi:hypothetical protein